MPAQNIPQPALDAIALVRLADYLADGKTDARTGRFALRRQEPAHRSGPTLATRSRIGTLKICMLAQSRPSQRLANLWRDSARCRREALLLRLGKNAHRKLIGSRPDTGGL